ncbi:MAG: hypothetical protein M1298_01680 [Chloroflexi bacterium]|nr:hypothetical protein [Chloroflexota bacterium]
MFRHILASFSMAATLTLTVAGSAFAATSITVPLGTQNNSGVSGTATLTEMGNQTQVVIHVTGEPSSGSEPAHIHIGTCANLGAVKYPLANVVNGTSTTVVNASLPSLMTGNFAINLHKSAAQIRVYVACGDIPRSIIPTAAPTTGAGGLATTQSALPLAGALALGLGAVALQRRRSEA